MEHDHEFFSVCCGTPEMGSFHGFCSRCRDHCVFECECGAYRLSRNAEVHSSQDKAQGSVEGGDCQCHIHAGTGEPEAIACSAGGKCKTGAAHPSHADNKK